MAFEDDIYRIYMQEKERYGIKIMNEQNTPHPEYEFETFEEWKKNHGY